jgi:hypothetical protein
VPITYEPPTNRHIIEELAPVRVSLMRQVARRRTFKRASISAAVLAALSVGGVSVAIGEDPSYYAKAEYMTNPLYVEQFADCMTAHGWEPLPGNGTDTPSEYPTVHFVLRPEDSGPQGEDAQACRASIAKIVGEPIDGPCGPAWYPCHLVEENALPR